MLYIFLSHWDILKLYFTKRSLSSSLSLCPSPYPLTRSLYIFLYLFISVFISVHLQPISLTLFSCPLDIHILPENFFWPFEYYILSFSSCTKILWSQSYWGKEFWISSFYHVLVFLIWLELRYRKWNQKHKGIKVLIGILPFVCEVISIRIFSLYYVCVCVTYQFAFDT